MSERQAFADLLGACLSPWLFLSEDQIALLYEHYRLLVRWNRVLNLTSVDQMPEAVVRHYGESLFLGAHLPAEAATVLDVGSGAGFPGIPVAVLRPACSITLSESHRRKAVFLREATREYRNVVVAAERAETVPGPFDWTISRAVRWQDSVKVAKARIALLLGQEDADAAAHAPRLVFEAPIPLPWGRRRVLLIGECSTWNRVPRETC